MKLNQLREPKGARKRRMRVGRGPGSGKGETAGRGVKGQKSRSGVRLKGFEGGQMPIHRRVPKRGFTNIFRKPPAITNLERLQRAIDAKKLDPAKPINEAKLAEAGVVRKARNGVKLLGKGALKAKITIEVSAASEAAVKAVEKAGGKVILPPKPKTDEKAEAKKAESKGEKPERKPEEKAEAPKQPKAQPQEKKAGAGGEDKQPGHKAGGGKKDKQGGQENA